MPKFMDETNIIIKRYSHGLFWVDVWEELRNGEPYFWAAIQKKDCSIRVDLFGCPVRQKELNEIMSLDNFINMVENNLPTHEAAYCEKIRKLFQNEP